jgi:hypothetical protein
LERVKLLYELTRYFKYKLLINRLNVKTWLNFFKCFYTSAN